MGVYGRPCSIVSGGCVFSPRVSDSGREHPSNRYFDESEPEDLCRIFVALFDYDPLSMSPNPDAADEELPFKEGQIIRVSTFTAVHSGIWSILLHDKNYITKWWF